MQNNKGLQWHNALTNQNLLVGGAHWGDEGLELTQIILEEDQNVLTVYYVEFKSFTGTKYYPYGGFEVKDNKTSYKMDQRRRFGRGLLEKQK